MRRLLSVVIFVDSALTKPLFPNVTGETIKLSERLMLENVNPTSRMFCPLLLSVVRVRVSVVNTFESNDSF